MYMYMCLYTRCIVSFDIVNIFNFGNLNILHLLAERCAFYTLLQNS